jgi:glucose/arabinose dehydrogenase
MMDRLVSALAILALLAAPVAMGAEDTSAPTPACDVDATGLTLPEGLCAVVFAREAGRVRNLAVAANGDIFAALRAHKGDPHGGALALRDMDGDGRAERSERFAEGDAHGLQLTNSHLYLATQSQVLRWSLAGRDLAPCEPPEVIVSGFPDQRSHAPKAIALADDGALFVEIGAPSNACQTKARTKGSPGLDPCPQLELQAGIWRYEAENRDQAHVPEKRFATGLRHALGLAIDPATGLLWGAVNGRDQLGGLWDYSQERNAELPAQELVRIDAGDEFGWPYCYHDGLVGRKVLAPEYDGDGERQGRCAGAEAPVLAFPAHWAPMAIHFYRGKGPVALPSRYAQGAFVALRGSWNRAPLPQAGYRIAFVPFADGAPTRAFETFAIGAESPTAIRFTGVGEGPDGSLYLAADESETIWRVWKPGR